MSVNDSPKCYLAYDDSIIAGDYVFPCIIYMREKGKPICKVGPDMRKKRVEWADSHNCFEDPICQKNCLDVCCMYNNSFRDNNPLGNKQIIPCTKVKATMPTINETGIVYEIGDRGRFEKWAWKMDYCKKHCFSPGDEWVWDYVETIWEKYQLEKKNEQQKVHDSEVAP